MNIKQVLFTGFGIIVSIVGIATGASQITNNYLQDSENWVVHTYQVQGMLKGLEKSLVDAETGQRGFLFIGDESFLEPYNLANQQIDDDFSSLKELISDNPEQVERLVNVQNLSEQKLGELEETINLKRAGKNQELFALVTSGKGKQIMDAIRSKLGEMVNVEKELLEKRQKEAEKAHLIVTYVTWGSLGIVVIVSGITLIWINKIAIQPINKIATTIASSSSQIAATIQQQEHTAAQQASSVNETTTTVDELGASSRQSVEQADIATNAAQKALDLAHGGNKAVEKTLEEMLHLKQKVESVANQILNLKEQTNQIGNISQLVSDIANQTNMLALNASVEAVRAGEHGKGFSVVAAEIRKLADQSKKSADSINLLVTQIQNSIQSTVAVSQEGTKSVEAGMNITQETAQAFVGVTDVVNNVVISNQQIALNVKQQLMAIEQIIQAMNSINQGAKETAISISQSRSGTQQLNSIAQELKAII